MCKQYEYRIEVTERGPILAGIIIPTFLIKANQVWVGSGGATVFVEKVENDVVYYNWWNTDGEKQHHRKDAFAFQCRYCIFLDAKGQKVENYLKKHNK